MSENTTIYESFSLPSKGMIYGEPFNPTVTLRSMTTAEEMKRLSPSDSEYRVMSDIIEECMKEKLPVKVYDLCLGDYQYLLHKLRIVTYGSNYNMTIKCPNCGEIVQASVNLDDIEVFEYDEDTFGSTVIELPSSKVKVELSLQTPRMLDEIKEKSKSMSRKTKQKDVNYELLYTVMSFIKKYDGMQLDDVKLESVVRSMPMKDVYYIIQEGDKLNRKVGLDTSVIAQCSDCGYEVLTQFRIQSEFFGPTIY